MMDNTAVATSAAGDCGSCCRTCLSTSRQMLPLLETGVTLHSSTEKITYLDCLRTCTQSEIPISSSSSHLHKYPIAICLRCSKALQVTYHFLKLAKESEATLSGIVNAAVVKQEKLEAVENEYMLVVEQQVCGKIQDTEDFVMNDKTVPEPIRQHYQSQQSTFQFSAQFQKFIENVTKHKTDHTENRIECNDVDLANQEPKDMISKNIKNIQSNISIEEDINDSIKTEENATKEYKPNDVIIYEHIMHEQNDFVPENDCKTTKNVMGSIESLPNDIIYMIENDNDCETIKQSAKLNNKEYTKLNEAAQNFIEEIKENLQNSARDFTNTLVRNKMKTIEVTKELENALENKEAEVDNNELICMQCNKRFNDMHTFVRHRRRHKGITPFRCSSCNFFTCYSESLRKHYKRLHNIEATNEMLNRPIQPHSTPMEKPYYEITYICKECPFETPVEKNINVHINKEHFIMEDLDTHILKAFNCPDCHRSFKVQKAMHTHFTLTHGTSMGTKKFSNETFVCEHCDKEFSFKASLVAHQRVCRLRDAVYCDICNKKISTVRKFEQHLRLEHAVETLHECEVCGKIFNNPESLRAHRKRHSERHYQCDRCPRNYINNAELRVHMERMHSTVPKALCRVCGMTFTHIGLLREHENKKHYQKFVKCLYCDYQSTSRCGVRFHQITVHTGKPYKCNVCGKEFALRAILRRHAMNQHSVQLTDQELAAMFRKKFGYPSRYDAFSKSNNTLEITEVNENDIEKELQESGLDFDDIIKDLFNNNLNGGVLDGNEDLFNLGS